MDHSENQKHNFIAHIVCYVCGSMHYGEDCIEYMDINSVNATLLLESYLSEMITQPKDLPKRGRGGPRAVLKKVYDNGFMVYEEIEEVD